MAIGVPLCRMAQKRANAPELPAAAATAASMRVLAAAVIVCKITEMWSSSRGECRGGAKGASGARGANGAGARGATGAGATGAYGCWCSRVTGAGARGLRRQVSSPCASPGWGPGPPLLLVEVDREGSGGSAGDRGDYLALPELRIAEHDLANAKRDRDVLDGRLPDPHAVDPDFGPGLGIDVCRTARIEA